MEKERADKIRTELERLGISEKDLTKIFMKTSEGLNLGIMTDSLEEVRKTA